MKKKIVFGFIFLLFLAAMIYSFFKIESTDINKKNMEKEINSLKKKIKNEEEECNNYEEELANLKEESKDKLEEVEIWKKAEKSLEQNL